MRGEFGYHDCCGMARARGHHDLCHRALAAAASGGDVKQAPGEAPQSGGASRNAQTLSSHKYSMKEEPNGN